MVKRLPKRLPKRLGPESLIKVETVFQMMRGDYPRLDRALVEEVVRNFPHINENQLAKAVERLGMIRASMGGKAGQERRAAAKQAKKRHKPPRLPK